ncbi:MAG: ABC transporter ATP-binding protein [Saprospirales bacterium]|nr:MAG: ABC transporter ATP-binding protein [Saprospirales bacterium]
MKLKVVSEFFNFFSYFYKYVGYRIYILILLGLIMGVLDGFGIAMFIPLIEIAANESGAAASDYMGRLAFLIDFIDSTGLQLTLNSVLVVMLVFFMLKGLISYIKSLKSVKYIQLFTRKIREEIISGLSSFGYSFLVASDSGRIQNTLSGEAHAVVRAFNIYLKLLHAIGLLVVYLILAFLAHFQFAIFVMIAGLLMNILFSGLFKKSKKLSRKITIQNHEFQGLIIQKILHFKYLKATGLIKTFALKLKNQVRKIEETNKRTGIILAFFDSIREPLTVLIIVLIILVQVNLFGGSISMLLLSIFFFYRSMTSIMSAQNLWNRLQTNAGAIENMVAFNHELSEGEEYNGQVPFLGLRDGIEFRDVGFSYIDGVDVINGIDLKIKKGSVVAIVGESGAGKTTLVNLLCGLIYPVSGELIIDENEIRKLDIVTYQKKIGYITQEPVIFNASIFDNVSFWEEATEENKERFRKALEQARIVDFVDQLNQQEYTILGTNGLSLSGGQRQRITIARELYKKVDILILDEATSSLDSETEADIRLEIEQLKGNYTMIIIAHRLSTIKTSDQVVLLKEGSIDAVGTYEELLNSSEDFKKMVELQTL